jgi:hypothetical protein
MLLEAGASKQMEKSFLRLGQLIARLTQTSFHFRGSLLGSIRLQVAVVGLLVSVVCSAKDPKFIQTFLVGVEIHENPEISTVSGDLMVPESLDVHYPWAVPVKELPGVNLGVEGRQVVVAKLNAKRFETSDFRVVFPNGQPCSRVRFAELISKKTICLLAYDFQKFESSFLSVFKDDLPILVVEHPDEHESGTLFVPIPALNNSKKTGGHQKPTDDIDVTEAKD